MFNKEVYVRRRKVLIDKMSETAPEGNRGIVLFLGNAEAPAQYKDNCYNFRQDSSWLYFFGIDRPLYAAVIDLDDGKETVFSDDVEIDDIIWMGPQEAVRTIAESVGVGASAPYNAAADVISSARRSGRPVHFLPPSRYYNTIKLASLTGCTLDAVSEVGPVSSGGGMHASLELVKAVISMRIVKEDCEIEEIDKAGAIGQEMHNMARNNVKPGVMEQEVVGKMEGVTLGKGWGVSFPTILSQHGETLHNHLHDKLIEPGNLMVIDAGAENNMHYASDFTRTLPTGGKFTKKQREIYSIVYDCNEYAFSLIKPGVSYRYVHLSVAKKMLEELRALDIVRGNLDNMVEAGVAGLFMPHGLGHNMGLDVHDMEDLGEDLVGYDPDQKRSSQLGLGSLRMARKLVPGNVITDEPGIYFIPALINKWKAEKADKGYVNYHRLESYYNFGGIRLEDDVLVTPDGARRTGPNRLPITPDDVEAAMSGE
ncbi:MAG: Xaa-Pro aminopeptidase [Bacteroidales bacterium]|nr:Xaa-Pro aminopeptidase [Bacteroidales bacterium]MCI1784938.1 Xaa-Pro aminopeptidase [Bacteroidales bacterium]